MKLTEILNPAACVVDMTARTKKEALRELSSALANTFDSLDANELLGLLLPVVGAREHEGREQNEARNAEYQVLHLGALLFNRIKRVTIAVNARRESIGIDKKPNRSMYSSVHETP